MLQKEKSTWLIGVDLDGTLLDKKGKLPKKNIEVIKKLSKKGHKVVIITGRPYRSSKFVYDDLGLDTIIANHNGAVIHNPSDPGFVKIETSLNREIIKEFLNDPILNNNIQNFAVESKTKLFIKERDKWLEDFFFVKGAVELIECSTKEILKKKLDIDPYSMLILLKSKYSNDEISRIILELKTKYGETFMMRSWQHPEINNQIVLEINPISTDKFKALNKIRSYYNIHNHKTMTFGDGLNDVQMLHKSQYGIVMLNANESVRLFGNDLTFSDNNDAGVGKYLEKWFQLK